MKIRQQHFCESQFYGNSYNPYSSNFMLTYLKKKACIPRNSISSYQLKPNLALRGQPTATTADITEANNQIATTEFVSKYFNNFANKYSVTNNINNNYQNTAAPFYHITTSVYQIFNSSNLVVETECKLYLPTHVTEGSTITIVNSSGTEISVHSYSGDIIYNSFYLPPEGDTVLPMDANKTAYFTYIYNHTRRIQTWIVSVY